jgi:hypothetical protein
LEKIGQLGLLFKNFDSVTIPPSVQSEFGQNIEWLIVKSVQNTAVVNSLKTQIGDGESEAMALAMEMADVLFRITGSLYKEALRLAKEVKE